MTPRDAAQTKERILGAAFETFAESGFAGARVDEIATRAGCNKALLYQYFGDKEALFRCVLEDRMQAFVGAGQGDPEQFADLAGDFFDFHAANPWLTRLLQWEALDFGRDPVPNERNRAERVRQHVDRLADAQRAGTVDPDLDPRQTIATMMGVVQFWFAFPQLARMVAGGDPYTKKALAARREHVVDVARRILEPRER